MIQHKKSIILSCSHMIHAHAVSTVQSSEILGKLERIKRHWGGLEFDDGAAIAHEYEANQTRSRQRNSR